MNRIELEKICTASKTNTCNKQLDCFYLFTSCWHEKVFFAPQSVTSRSLFLTSVTCLSCVAAEALTVGLAQARHSTLPVLAAEQAARVGCVLLLFVAQDAREAGLAAAGVGVGVDGNAGSMNAPEGSRGLRTNHKSTNKEPHTLRGGTPLTCFRHRRC